jgi:uncharacterized protein (TIGR02271 family)
VWLAIKGPVHRSCEVLSRAAEHYRRPRTVSLLAVVPGLQPVTALKEISMANTRSSLRKLSEVDDLEVAPDNPDIRGWNVVDAGDRVIGEVDDLIVDPQAMKVRFLTIDLDKDALNLQDGRSVLVPITNVQLDGDEKRARLVGIDRTAVLQLESADAGQWEADDPSLTRERTDVTDSARPETEETRLTRSAEELRIGKRRVAAGEVRVGKHVETEHVRQPVETTRDRVVVERRPVSGEMRVDANISESGEIRVPVVEEEVVVEKRPVVKEEIVISKERITETEQVEADVRREEFDIEKTGRIDVDEPGGRGSRRTQ